jgi:hypothetical protein
MLVSAKYAAQEQLSLLAAQNGRVAEDGTFIAATEVQ